jgi:hypothetical protein
MASLSEKGRVFTKKFKGTSRPLLWRLCTGGQALGRCDKDCTCNGRCTALGPCVLRRFAAAVSPVSSGVAGGEARGYSPLLL